MQIKELIEVLEKEYPNDITQLSKMDEKKRDAYIAQIELIEHIKRLEKDN